MTKVQVRSLEEGGRTFLCAESATGIRPASHHVVFKASNFTLQASAGFSRIPTIRPTPQKSDRNLYSDNSAKTPTTIRPVTIDALNFDASINATCTSPLRVRVVPDWHPCHPARLQLGVHALAFSVLSSLAIANGPSDSNRERFKPNWLTSTANPLQAGERILRRHCGGIVPPLFSSNITDKASRHHASNITHWNVHSGSAGSKRFYFGRDYFPAASESN